MRASPRSTLWPQSVARKVRQAQQRRLTTVTWVHTKSRDTLTMRNVAQMMSRAPLWTATTRSGSKSLQTEVVASPQSGAPSSQPLTRTVYLLVISLPSFNFMMFRSICFYDQWSALISTEDWLICVLDGNYHGRGKLESVCQESRGHTRLGEKFE